MQRSSLAPRIESRQICRVTVYLMTIDLVVPEVASSVDVAQVTSSSVDGEERSRVPAERRGHPGPSRRPDR